MTEIKTIYQMLKEYSKEQIDEEISNLSDKEKELMMERYGPDLEHPQVSEKWDTWKSQDFYGKLLPKLRRNLSIKTNQREEKIKQESSIQTIYTLLKQYTKEQIDEEISNLTDEEKALLELKYGPDLSNPKESSNWNTSLELEFYGKLLYKIRTTLSKKYNPKRKGSRIKTIYEIFNEYTEEEINNVLKALTSQEKALLRARYGDDLKYPILTRHWSDIKANQFNNYLLPKIKKLLDENQEKNKGNIIKKGDEKMPRIIKPIYEYLKEFEREDIDFVIANLTPEQKELLNLRYGPDLENPVTSEKWNSKIHGSKLYTGLIPLIKQRLYIRQREKYGQSAKTPVSTTKEEISTTKNETAFQIETDTSSKLKNTTPESSKTIDKKAPNNITEKEKKSSNYRQRSIFKITRKNQNANILTNGTNPRRKRSFHNSNKLPRN